MHTRTSSTLLFDLKDSRNERAWTLFLERYRPLIASYARRRGLQPSDADDVAQETLLAFVSAHRAGRYDKEKGRFRTWLGRIAANKTADALRGLMRRAAQPVDADTRTGLLEGIEHEGRNGHEQLWQQEWEAFLLQSYMQVIASEFDPQTVSAFESYAIEDRSPDEVAKTLGISRNAVYIAKSRVLERMRQLRDELELELDG